MRGVEQVPWLYDAGLSLLEKTGLGRWRAWLAGGVSRGRVLDIGCGTGRNLPLFGSGVRAIGLDPCPQALRRARRRAPGAPLVRARAESLPFRDGCFDTVVSGLVFCSVSDVPRALDEVRRVLKAGGVLRMLEHVRSRRRGAAWLQDRTQPAWTWFTGGCHPNRDTEAAVAAAGFVVDPASYRAQRSMRRFEAHPPGREASSLPEALGEFLAARPGYARTGAIDDLRTREFARLDALQHVYLDYTGSGLYAASQVERHSELLLANVLGNPHSSNPTSTLSTRLVERCRGRVLDFFRADPAEYAVVFTANASHALKLVGESYPFGPGDQFLLTFDNHNSVNGIREFDRARGARTLYLPMVPPELRVDEGALDRALEGATPHGHNLFAFPAQSNFSGVQHPLEWIARAQARGWDVLLDAAAFVPSNRLDLSRFHPDFVALSFYKMFGYPTGVGALLARKAALAKLHRPWFAGGTISVASVQADRFVLAAGAAAFEDGTLDFANIPAVELGLDLLESVGIDVVHERVRLLTGWLIDELLALHHGNGRPLVRLYGPRKTDGRGGTLALNLYDAAGHVIDHPLVERSAGERQISLRTGCFCNPGAGEVALGLTRREIETCFAAGDSRLTYDDLRRCIDPHEAGAVRVSLGLVSNFADVLAFREFAKDLLQP